MQNTEILPENLLSNASGDTKGEKCHFLLHPLIAYFEDRHNSTLDQPVPWLIRVALDSLWYPLAA